MTQTPAPARRPNGAAFVIAAILAALGAVLIREAGIIPDKGGYSGVGPAGMPLLVGWGLMILAVWTAIDAWKGRFGPHDKPEFMPVLWIVLGLVLQLSLLKLAGFSIASGLLFACTAFAFGKRNLALTLPIGIVFAFAVYGVFDRILQLNLPAGPLETLIFGG
ncbi:MAG: tripartite tricarboxylate transporter TctB family protein [Pseudomonadota bacterium]